MLTFSRCISACFVSALHPRQRSGLPMTTVVFKASALVFSRWACRVGQVVCFLMLCFQSQPTQAGPDDLTNRHEAAARTSHAAEAQGLDRTSGRQRFATPILDRSMTSDDSGVVAAHVSAASVLVTALVPGGSPSGRCGEGTVRRALDLARYDTSGVDAGNEDPIFDDGFDPCTPQSLGQVCGLAGAPPLCGVVNNNCGVPVNCGAGFCQAVGGACEAGVCQCPSNAYLCLFRPYCKGQMLNPCSGQLLNCNGCPPGGGL